MRVAGLLLAAGAGRRMGGPKALLRAADRTPFLHRSVAALVDGGCAGVTVVLGAGSGQARGLLAGLDVEVVVAEDWDEGMGASLRAGLRAVGARPAVEAALVSLVDLPDVDAAVVRRVVATGGGRAALARATYRGAPGHPVLLGVDHWDGVLTTARGDQGARDYLASRDPVLVECGDLATGRDLDHPTDRS